jgi:GDPmannose 4,6-dehydratase
VRQPTTPQSAIVTGATGQDGYYLVLRLLASGWTVHAAVRDEAAAATLFPRDERLHLVTRNLHNPGPLSALIGEIRPEELYNLAGESSVGASFADPRATWDSNAHVVVHLLDAVRTDSPATRVYQASSSEMFGSLPGASVNHESRRRGKAFLTRKVVDHVLSLRMDTEPRTGSGRGPLALGNLKAQRDWGYAPDYVDAMIAILRQASIRSVPDEARFYRDYVLGTGRLHHVWELVDQAFAIAGFDLTWRLHGDDPLEWGAVFTDSGEPAVVVDSAFIRPSDPIAIAADPSRIAKDLGWEARTGIDAFLVDMLADGAAVPQ